MKDLDAKKDVLARILSMLDDGDKTTLKSRKQPKKVEEEVTDNEES